MVDVRGTKNPNYKTGLAMPNAEHKGVYNSWQNMKSRCLNPRHPKYYRYGGRGVKICKPWLNVKTFYEWALANGWEPGKTIDRIDNDGDYCPENCRWVSMSENSRKKRTTKIDQKTAEEIRSRACEDWYLLAKEYGCSHGNIWFIMNGYTHVAEGDCTKAIAERSKNNKVKTRG